MLNSFDLVQKMKTHFPRWMDIRKRVYQSDGGKLLTSIAEETANIQTAIDEYKKDFFIDRYIGREDQVVSFVYKLHIGVLDKNQLIIVSPNVEITEDLNKFYSETGLAFYEDGNLFFRVEDIDQDKLEIKYSIDGYETNGSVEKIHVWNVFDEFATFVGLERHTDETNKQLEDRILNVFKRRTNSTEVGLKNSILNELLYLDPNLEMDEISISKPTPENLIKHYKEFGSVIEKLANVNRDVYRTKRWDIDTWNYALKSIDYLPHAWDYALEEYQNGVGFEDDLKVALTSPDDTTGAIITFYSKSIQEVREYVKNKEIKTDIELKLSQYDNVLKPITAKYKITASEAVDITDAPIIIDNREIITGEENRYIDELVTEVSKDHIKIEDLSLLSKGKKYKIIFAPKSSYSTMEIKKCSLLSVKDDIENETSLLKEKVGYVFNENNYLINNSVKLYATKIKDFSLTSNIINGPQGLSLENLDRYSFLDLDLTNMGDQNIHIGYDCPLSDLLNIQLNNNGFIFNNGVYSCKADPIEKSIEIVATANQISLEFLEGNCTIETQKDGIVNTTIHNGSGVFKTEISQSPSEFKVKIIPTSMRMVSFQNIKYSKFEFNYFLQKDSIRSIGGKLTIPNYDENKLTIEMRSFSGYSPILKHVFVGSNLENVTYETEIISTSTIDDNKIRIESNCDITLIELDNNENIINTIENYNPHCEYIALSDQAYIKLDLSAYSYVESLKAPQGRFETIGTGSNISYYMRLRKGDKAFEATIIGERLVGVIQKRLIDILNIKPESGDRLYITELSKSFIILKDGKQSLQTLTPSMINNIATEGCTIYGLPDDVSAEFILSKSDGASVVSNSHTGSFYAIHLFPKKSQTYIAFNNTKMVSREISDVDIVDVFNPFLPNDIMFYKVESLDPNNLIGVKFDQSQISYSDLNDWSLGRNKLRIVNNINMSDTSSYETTAFSIDKQFSLGDVIPLQRSYTMPTGEIIELPKYMIKAPEGMEIEYKTKPFVDTIVNAPEFYGVEKLIREEDGFNKLQYSNIDEIIYVGTSPWNPSGIGNAHISSSQYSVMHDEGIIVWNEASLLAGQPFYIVYTIMIPDCIKVNIDSLYKLIDYQLEAYKRDGVESFMSKADKDTVDLKPEYYKKNSIITIFCNKPGFEAKLDGGTVTFNKVAKNNMVAVKTGYYYMDGQEYYLFANESLDKIDKFMNTEFFNVDRTEGSMILNKRTNNFIKNSYMDLGQVSNIYNIDFTENKLVEGVSKLNSITACNSFDKWRTFGCNLSLVQGLNGLGIKIEQFLKNGYAFIDITDFTYQTSHLSFFSQGPITAYIGKEKKYEKTLTDKMSLKKSILIEPFSSEIKESILENNIKETTFNVEDNYRYYLIFKGDGIIDDLILQDGSNENKTVNKDIHKKNIDILNLDIEERIMKDYVSKLYFDSRYGATNGTEIDNGVIINSTKVDWGITKIKEFDDPKSWTKCKTNRINISNGILQTREGVSGTLETEAIYIGDKRIVESVIFEINDVLFDNMTGFNTRILTSKTLTGNYRSITMSNENIGKADGKMLDDYIKLVVEMPGDKIINNISIYVEYKSTKEAAPREFKVSNGEFISEILDTHYTSNYIVQGISIDSISNINDVDIQIRGAKENFAGEVWTPWKEIKLDINSNIKNILSFSDCRFFQAKISLKNRDAYIKLNNIELKVV